MMRGGGAPWTSGGTPHSSEGGQNKSSRRRFLDRGQNRCGATLHTRELRWKVWCRFNNKTILLAAAHQTASVFHCFSFGDRNDDQRRNPPPKETGPCDEFVVIEDGSDQLFCFVSFVCVILLLVRTHLLSRLILSLEPLAEHECMHRPITSLPR